MVSKNKMEGIDEREETVEVKYLSLRLKRAEEMYESMTEITSMSDWNDGDLSIPEKSGARLSLEEKMMNC